MLETDLYILREDKHWVLSKSKDTQYYMSEQIILGILNSIHGKGSINKPFIQDKIFRTDNIKIEILEVQSHRHCSILICMQQNFSTNGLRYLVYGIRRPGYEDYGIGTSLESFATMSDKYLPRKYIGKCKKYIDV